MELLNFLLYRVSKENSAQDWPASFSCLTQKWKNNKFFGSDFGELLGKDRLSILFDMMVFVLWFAQIYKPHTQGAQQLWNISMILCYCDSNVSSHYFFYLLNIFQFENFINHPILTSFLRFSAGCDQDCLQSKPIQTY